MANWSILDGTTYVDVESGSDTAGTGAIDAPYKSIQFAIDQLAGTLANGTDYKIVIGGGVYEEQIGSYQLFNGAENRRITFVGDGHVVIDQSVVGGVNNFGMTTNVNLCFLTMRNITIKGVSDMRNANAGNGTSIISWEECSFVDIPNIISVLRDKFVDCIFINCSFNQNSSVSTHFINCTFKATAVEGGTSTVGTYDSCHWTADCVWRGAAASITYSNLQGTFLNSSGTDNKSLYQVSAMFNIDEDPLFSAAAPNDVSLQASSPNANTGRGLTNRGARGIAQAAEGADGESALKTANGAIHVNITDTGTGYHLTDPTVKGSITSAPMDLGFSRRLNLVEMFTSADFDLNRLDSISGGMPGQISYEMRFADTQEETQAAEFTHYPINSQPLYDATNRAGNGDPSFDVNNANYVKAQWVQIRITIEKELG